MTVKSFFPQCIFYISKNREDYLEKLSFCFVLFWNGCFQPVFYSHGQKGWNSNSSDFSAIIPSPFLAMTVHITIEEYYKQSLNFLWLQNTSNIAAIKAIFWECSILLWLKNKFRWYGLGGMEFELIHARRNKNPQSFCLGCLKLWFTFFKKCIFANFFIVFIQFFDKASCCSNFFIFRPPLWTFSFIFSNF